MGGDVTVMKIDNAKVFAHFPQDFSRLNFFHATILKVLARVNSAAKPNKPNDTFKMVWSTCLISAMVLKEY